MVFLVELAYRLAQQRQEELFQQALSERLARSAKARREHQTWVNHGKWKIKPVAGALKDTSPFAISAFLYGTVFGVVAQKAGITVPETLLMSGLVFAGASQFAAVSLWAAGASALEIVLTTLVINLRHLLMGASLARYFPRWFRKPFLAVLAAGLSDESYVVSARYFAVHGASGRYLLTANALLYVAWFLSTLMGVHFGTFIARPDRYALDFAFPGAFIAILAPQLKDRPSLAAAVVAATVSVLAAAYIPGNWYVITATLVAAAVGAEVEQIAHR